MRSAYSKTWRIFFLTIVIGVLFFFYRSGLQREKYSRARADISDFQIELRDYHIDEGRYPTSDQGLALLSPFPNAEPDPGIDRGMRGARPPRNPWGNPYFYESDGESYTLGLFGSDPNRGYLDPKLRIDSK